jgi:hypothetical protein
MFNDFHDNSVPTSDSLKASFILPVSPGIDGELTV